MQREINIQDVKTNFKEGTIKDTNLIQKLKKAEEQIKNGEVTDADKVFKEIMEKYGY